MTKSLLPAVAFILLAGGVAIAQDAPDAPPPPDATATPAEPAPTRGGGAGIRSGNISATGRTMPGVGGSRGAGTTSLDRGIQAEDNKITSGICKGC